MDMITQLKSDLYRDEGCVDHYYTDSKGYATIGVGHLIDKRKGGHIPHSIIDQLLEMDIDQDVHQAQSHRWYQALDTDNRRRALLNMVFNLGSLGVSSFTEFCLFLEQKNWKAAAQDLRSSLWYRQVGERAERVCQLIEQG